MAREERSAIAISESSAITFADLVAESEICALALDDLGVRRNNRVGILLPNSPATITTFIGVTSRATAAPLNPAYGAAEFEFYLADLNVKALVIDSASDSVARRVAKDHGIPVIDVAPLAAGSARFSGSPGKRNEAVLARDAVQIDDVALVLHTSGTTSKPKIVPLTHANILSLTENIIRTLNLSSADRCLTIMPLFHIHGIMVTLSALLAGGQVCPVGFDPQQLFAIVDDSNRPGTPPYPRCISKCFRMAASYSGAVERSRLRFIRSSSASLPVRVKAELEKVFNAPVIEAYGMTEAAHQMASNPLPPDRTEARIRRIGGGTAGSPSWMTGAELLAPERPAKS